MEKELYGEMAELEESHWWFRGRRAIILDTLRRFCGERRGALLDVGSGTGLNGSLFKREGFRVEGVETASEAIAFSKRRAPDMVIRQESFPSDTLQSGAYEAVTLLDVLEHLEDDAHALRDVARVLKHDGIVLITVPAFQFLWSPHDTLAHHKRRYRRPALRALLQQAGLTPVFISYYNFFLFPAIALVRLVIRGLGYEKKESDFSATPKFLNSILAFIFGSERWLLRFTPLPFGVSIIAVARKR